MMPDREALKSNVVNYCKGSPKRVEILKAARKPANYEQIAKLVSCDKSYSSLTLNHLETLGALKSVPGKTGSLHQTPLMKTIDIDSELRKTSATSQPLAMPSRSAAKRKTLPDLPYFTPNDVSELSR